jgi:uncharacterized protein (TIGR03032 family)
MKLEAPELVIVSATRTAAEYFAQHTLLGRSLALPAHRRYTQKISCSNTAPLGVIYNAALERANPSSILVLCHDDLWLGEACLLAPLQEALQTYDLVGVAGNKHLYPGQITWWLQANGHVCAATDHVGGIRHGTPEDSRADEFGPSPAAASLLDGVFLAARAGVLRQAGVRFDTSLGFHFYDLDICRSALAAGLRLGVWPLPLIHASKGTPGSPAWQESLVRYRRKWEPRPLPPDHPPGQLAGQMTDQTADWPPEQSPHPLPQAPSTGAQPAAMALAGSLSQAERHLASPRRPLPSGPAIRGGGDLSGRVDPSPRAGSADPSEGAWPSVACTYEYTLGLPALLERLELSVLLTTYQAGRVVSLGSHQGELRIGFAHFDQAMGLCRTASGLALVSRDAIWSLPANQQIAASLHPEGEHDIAFLARSCHHSGPLMGHDLAWGGGRLWLVNTLFNGLVTIEGDWSFVPRWQPPFISGWAPADRCHLNGLALAADGSGPAYVTALGETDSENGWREHKATGGCLIDVRSGEVRLRGLSMPHSPRLYNGQLYLLDSGHGTLLRVDPLTGERHTIASLPGFTRGLDCFAGHAFVGLSQIRETAVFGGLPLQHSGQELRCGLAIVNLSSGTVEGFLWFNSGVEEVFAAVVLPGWRHPALIGPDTSTDASQTVWLVPPGS